MLNKEFYFYLFYFKFLQMYEEKENSQIEMWPLLESTVQVGS
jgi:hypothetical protein